MPVHLAAPDHEPMGDDPVLYQIRVNGQLGPTFLAAFPALMPQHKGTETVHRAFSMAGRARPASRRNLLPAPVTTPPRHGLNLTVTTPHDTLPSPDNNSAHPAVSDCARNSYPVRGVERRIY